MKPGMHLIKSLCLIGMIAVWGTAASIAKEQPSDVPAWLRSHIGEGESQIARVVLQRARAHYLKKVAAGVVKNPCYFAMDATRPNEGRLGKRFYTICEAEKSFRAAATGHGSGRNMKGVPNFSNGRGCAKNFGNALDSVSDDRRRLRDGRDQNLVQGLLSQRETGCRPDALVRSVRGRGRDRQCQGAGHRRASGRFAEADTLSMDAAQSHANENGCVPVGTLEDYSGGRSNGCTSWSRSDADRSFHCSRIRRRSTSTRNPGISRRLRKPSRRASRLRPTARTGTPPA